MSDERLAVQSMRLGTPANVAAGTVLTTEGTPGRAAFVVVDGIARVTVNGKLLCRIGPGAFIGEMALIDHRPHTASVVADTSMRILSFDAPAFAALLEDPDVSRALRRALVTRLRAVLSGGYSD